MSGYGILGTLATASYVDHARDLGVTPDVGHDFINVLERSGLRGRGGGAFPTAIKWAAVRDRCSRKPVVLVNGAEGEPASTKDRMLMTTRPHLVIDGALIAARAVSARDVVFYVGGAHAEAIQSMRVALAQRPESERTVMSMIAAPPGYVAGEETAAVGYVNDGVALPQSVPPRPYERGVRGRPTLVNNVETLAHVALIARFGEARYRGAGRGDAVGTVLLTVGGAVRRPGVIEVAHGTLLSDVVSAAGGLTTDVHAVLVGGYFGTWHTASTVWNTALDAGALKSCGHTLGCGVVHTLGTGACGVVTTARVLAYLAGESAQQCGPCMFGLRALATTTERVAAHDGSLADLQHLLRWAGLVRGRGACRHPDGASQLLRSALTVFSDDFAAHARHRRCLVQRSMARAS